jgi:hypothetical protein
VASAPPPRDGPRPPAWTVCLSWLADEVAATTLAKKSAEEQSAPKCPTKRDVVALFAAADEMGP